MNRFLLLLACSPLFLPTVVTMAPDCWYRAEFCRVEDGHNPIDIVQVGTNEAQLLECYHIECYNSTDCVEFTLLSDREGSECYLFNEPCTRIVDDPCISQGCCVSGPRDCDESPVKSCPKLVYSGSEYMSWQCINNLGGKFDAFEEDVPAGSSCYLS